MQSFLIQSKLLAWLLKTDKTCKKNYFKPSLTCAIDLLFINHVYWCIWKKDGVLLGIKVNSNKERRISCHWNYDVFLGRDGEWDPTNSHFRWENQELLNSYKEKDREQSATGWFLPSLNSREITYTSVKQTL